MAENQKRGIICGNDTRYTKGTEVEILTYFKTSNEYFVKPVEGQIQFFIKPDDLEVLDEGNI